MTRRKTGPDRATVDLVRARDGDRCLRCRREYQQIHHRKPRGMCGTTDPAINGPENLICVCQDCHSWIETHRAQARAEGWLVSQWGDPAAVPLVINHLPVWLGADGLTYPRKDDHDALLLR